MHFRNPTQPREIGESLQNNIKKLQKILRLPSNYISICDINEKVFFQHFLDWSCKLKFYQACDKPGKLFSTGLGCFYV